MKINVEQESARSWRAWGMEARDADVLFFGCPHAYHRTEATAYDCIERQWDAFRREEEGDPGVERLDTSL